MAIDASRLARLAPAEQRGASDWQLRRTLARAWQQTACRRVAQAEQALNWLVSELGSQHPDVQAKYGRAVDILKAALFAIRDEAESAMRILARRPLHPDEAPSEVHAAVLLYVYWRLGHREAFYALRRPIRDSGASRARVAAESVRLCVEAMVAIAGRNLPLAKRLSYDALSLADNGETRRSQSGALPACLLAETLYEEGCLREAESLLRTRVLLADIEPGIETALRACAIQVAIAKSRAHFGLAVALLRDAIAQGQRRKWPRLVAAAQSERVAILLSRGKISEAGACVTELERLVRIHVDAPVSVSHAMSGHLALAQCRYAWSLAPSQETLARFNDIYQRELCHNHLYTSSRLAVELAAMLHVFGDSNGADSLFLDTLRSGMASGLHQMFIDGGPLTGSLLVRARAGVLSGGSIEMPLLPYIDQASAHWQRQARARVLPRARPGTAVLTERELAVLALIGNGCSNKSIAQVLKISPETVKSHVRNIFTKLGATARSEAVAKAIALSHI